MRLEEKIKELGLAHIESDPEAKKEILTHAKYGDADRFKYFKDYGNTRMYYSNEYLEENSIVKLMEKHFENENKLD